MFNLLHTCKVLLMLKWELTNDQQLEANILAEYVFSKYQTLYRMKLTGVSRDLAELARLARLLVAKLYM